MKAEDRLTDLLRDTANGYHPRGGLAQIEDKVVHRRRARRVRRVALPVAAAVVIAAVALPLALRGGKHHSQRLVNVPPATTVPQPEPGTTQVAAAAKPTTPPSTVFQGPAGGPVPPGFLAASVTFISPSNGWVLGTAPCATPPCTSIVRTTDGGRTWRGIPAPRAPLTTANGSPAAATLRFANVRDGFAFNPGLWTTHDGGAHWRKVETVAGITPALVSDLAVTPDGVYAIVEGAVAGGGGDGHGRLVHGDPHGDNFVVVHDFGANGVNSLAVGGRTLYNIVIAGPGAPTTLLGRFDGQRFVTRALPDPTACLEIAPSSDRDLIIECGQAAMSGSQGNRSLYGSTNGGDSWTKLPDPGRGAGWETGGIADAGGGHAVIGTSDAGGAGLLVTTDAGQHWTEALHLDNTGGETWGELGFENRTTGVVVFGPYDAAAVQQGNSPGPYGGGTLYRTTDGGVTWSKVHFSA